MGRTIAVALPKGGVGKTTTAVNLAASFALAGRQTLLIDADAFGSSAIALGITGEKIRAGLFDVFNCTHALSQVIHRTELPFLDLVPSNVRSIAMEERLLKIADNRNVLKQALVSVRQNYEYIIIDTPPYLRGMTTNALTASDSVIIPVRAGHFSLDAVEKLFKFLKWMKDVARISMEVEGILLTMHERKTKAGTMTFRELAARYSSLLFKTVIPKNSIIAESTFYGKPVVLVNSECPGALAFHALAEEILSRHPASPPTISTDNVAQAQSA
jgi:chromosome partitioning protein